MEWNKYPEKKPELDQEVIFATKWYINGNAVGPGNAMGGIYSNKITSTGAFCDLSLMFTYPEVKYWIPLPKEPKE